MPRQLRHRDTQELEGGKGGAQHRVYLRSEPAYGNSKALFPSKKIFQWKTRRRISRKNPKGQTEQETELTFRVNRCYQMCAAGGGQNINRTGVSVEAATDGNRAIRSKRPNGQDKRNPRGSWASDFSARLHGSHYVVLMMIVDTI